MTPSGQGRMGRKLTDGVSAGSSETVLKEASGTGAAVGEKQGGEAGGGAIGRFVSFHYT